MGPRDWEIIRELGVYPVYTNHQELVEEAERLRNGEVRLFRPFECKRSSVALGTLDNYTCYHQSILKEIGLLDHFEEFISFGINQEFYLGLDKLNQYDGSGFGLFDDSGTDHYLFYV